MAFLIIIDAISKGIRILQQSAEQVPQTKRGIHDKGGSVDPLDGTDQPVQIGILPGNRDAVDLQLADGEEQTCVHHFLDKGQIQV